MATAPLEVYLLTFNCARALIEPTLLGSHLFNAWPRDRQGALPDVVAISLQEVAPIAYSFLGGRYLTPYLERVEDSVHYAARKQLKRKRGSGDEDAVYEQLVVHNVGMTVTMVFVKKELRERVSRIEVAGVGVGVWEMGNKGGVGVRFGIDQTELTFVGMHLAPMEGMILRRNQDWEDICRGLVFSDVKHSTSSATGEREPLLAGSKHESSTTGLYKRNNHIFLFGDLNYRTAHLPPTPTSYKQYPQPASHPAYQQDRISLADLYNRDQLTQERLANRTLHGFAEQPIDFAPTYKYSHSLSELPGPTIERADGTDENHESVDETEVVVEEPSIWTWARHRWPSWCDRILFYPPTGLTPGVYTALPLLPSSDHRGVVLHVTLDLATTNNRVEDDLCVKPPFELDGNWRYRRAAARRYEFVVGVASWFALTGEGNATLAALFGSALGIFFLIRVFGQGV